MDDAEPSLNPTVDFLAGTIGGMVGLAVGFPFDTVKVRFQNPAISGKYTTTIGALFTILAEERVIGLYRGISSPIATVALMNGLVFASYRFFINLQSVHANEIPTLSQIAIAGAASGIVSSIVTTPIELVKIRQQSTPYATSARGVALQLIRQKGITSLYRGLGATALRDIGYGAYFYSYELTYRYFIPAPNNDKPLPILPQWSVLLLAGGVAGVAGWLATFPLDVVKTRIQSSCADDTASLMNGPQKSINHSPPIYQSTRQYNSVMSTILHSYRDEGFSVFFRGLAPTLIREPLLGSLFTPACVLAWCVFPRRRVYAGSNVSTASRTQVKAIPVNMVTFAAFETIVHVAKAWGW